MLPFGVPGRGENSCVSDTELHDLLLRKGAWFMVRWGRYVEDDTLDGIYKLFYRDLFATAYTVDTYVDARMNVPPDYVAAAWVLINTTEEELRG